MEITTWQRHSRVIPARCASEFFDQPVSQIQVFLFETASLELRPHGGDFSLKLSLAGEEEYLVGNRTITVRPGDLLLVNAGQTYGSRIRKWTRSLSVFFPREHVAGVELARSSDEVRPLDAPDAGCSASIEVPQVRFSASASTRRAVSNLVDSLSNATIDAAEEAVMALLFRAWVDLGEIAPKAVLRGIRKSSTRDELLSRVCRAREYIEDMRGANCNLETLADIACLSKFHFLRVFKAVVGETPAAFARRRRLEAAAEAIARGDPQDIAARQAGYANRHVFKRALNSRQAQIQRN